MSEAGALEVEVPSLLAGVRVDRAVAMLANVSRMAAAELVAAGGVSVDGVVVSAGRHTLREGARLTIRLREARTEGVEAEAGVEFGVVHADSEVVVVDKPAGLVVHPGAGHRRGTLVGGLLGRFPDLAGLVASGTCPADRPGIVHRLDKGTSGLLVVARTEPAFRSLVAQLAERTMERRYLALVKGVVADVRGEIDAPIGRSSRTPTKMAISASGRSARTAYTVLERHGETTLVELRDHRIGVFEILTRTEFKQRSHADGLQVRYLTGDLGLAGEVADAVEFRLEWGEASGVDGLFVHAGGIEVADLLGGGIAAGGGLGGRFQNLVEDVAVAIRQFIEAAPHGLVGRNGVVLHPGTAGILIEIDAGVHRFVDRGEIKLRGAAGVTGGRLRGQDAECKRGSNCDLQ